MKNPAKNLRFIEQGSEWETSGIYAAKDWRYEALVDYLKLSPSYKLVCEWAKKGRNEIPANAPKDWKQILKIYDDFGDVWRIPESRWWDSRGRELFGIKAKKTQAFIAGNSELNELIGRKSLHNSQMLWENMAKPDCLLLAIPTNQTKQMALKQINAIVRSNTFSSSKPKLVKPKYELLRSKLREPTIKLGTMALKMYFKGVPLWAIGNSLKLSPTHIIEFDEDGNLLTDELSLADKKIRLQILASKLVSKAELIAENAARGNYPTDAPCKHALKFQSPTRKAGRPRASR